MTAITIRRSPSEALTTVEPVYSPMSLFEEMERFAGDVWGSWTPVVYHDHMHPRLDVFEQKDNLVMRTELPGIKKEDIDISLENDYLTVKAEKEEEMPEDTTYYSSERCFGSYLRSVELPFPVNGDKISATFENGLLEIRLPKAEEAKAKHIEIKVK